MDRFTQGRIWRLCFSLVWSGGKMKKMPPMGPVNYRDRDAWADLIAGWLQTAHDEGAALHIEVWHPGQD